MAKVRRVLYVAVVIYLMYGLVGVMSAQTPASQAPASLDDLLSEVRGLRAEINQAAAASIRAQLLVARLQVQEQRLAGYARQLTDLQTQLATASRQRAESEREIQRLVQAKDSAETPPDIQKDMTAMIKDVSSRTAQAQERERQVQAQISELQSVMASEQGRWIDFNDRLDALERSITNLGRP
jgi:chromosome segregation ATPase